MFKRCLSFILILSSFLAFASCGDDAPPYSHCEMVIPLTNDFYSADNENFDASFSNGEASAAVLRVSYHAALITGIPETLTAKQFGAYWLLQNDRLAELWKHGDVDYCVYDAEGIFHLAAFYRSKDAYFVLMFACSEQNESEWRDEFLKFCAGVYFVS